MEDEYGDFENRNRILTSTYSFSNSMFLFEVDEDEIIYTILNLKNGNSTGIDNMNTKLFKNCVDPLHKILPNLINYSFINGTFPCCLKTAKVIPIYKKSGSKNKLINYQPISLLNIISKIQC